MAAAEPVLAFFNNLGAPEMIVIGVIALLIFGKRLPEVGRSLGKSFVEFKKGLKDTTDEIKDVRTDAQRTMKSEGEDRPKPFNDPSNGNSRSNDSN